MILYEYRATGKRLGSPRLYSRGDFNGLAGFISVFGFGKEAVDYICYQKATRGVGKYPLYMDLLPLDFDNNPEAENKAIKWLRDNDISHQVYFTGNRGKHIHIKVQSMEQVGLHYLVKQVVGHLFPGADLSIYKPTGVIRIPGTSHHKTGKIMHQIDAYSGKIMHLEDHKPKSFVPITKAIEVDREALDFWLTRDLNKQVGSGERNEHVFSIAATAMKLGIDKEQIADMIDIWNRAFCCPPLRPGEISATINSVYRG